MATLTIGMDEPRCALSDLPVSSCGHCTGAEARARAAERTAYPAGVRTLARFPGRCAGCDGAIRPGDAITADAEGHGWLCPGCG